jgi:hypothetical protein
LAECNNPPFILALNQKEIPPNPFNVSHHRFEMVLLSFNGLSIHDYWDLLRIFWEFGEIDQRGDIWGVDSAGSVNPNP